MRAFLSYDISESSFLDKVRDLQQELSRTGADLKLVDPKLLHFTIRFLGEIDETDKEQIVDSLKDKVESLELEISFRGLGAFPDERRISVIWVGIDSSSAARLEKQAQSVNNLLKSVHTLNSDEKEERFSPHVTIARVRSGRNKDKLAEFIRQHRSMELGSTKIENLRLKLSHLTPAGPEYSDLHVFE